MEKKKKKKPGLSLQLWKLPTVDYSLPQIWLVLLVSLLWASPIFPFICRDYRRAIKLLCGFLEIQTISRVLGTHQYPRGLRKQAFGLHPYILLGVMTEEFAYLTSSQVSVPG